MDPRYQIFISSTFRDLIEERQAVLAAVLELGHFPAGMEAFPATSATPWDLIKKIISESDYYVLIIGARYGSTDEQGVSYTEREYDLACELNIPTLIFLHGAPDSIPAGKVEMDRDAQTRLATFRAKVERHHCKTWRSPEELKVNVVLSLIHEFRVKPRVGWIRSNKIDSPETLKKVNFLLEQNASLSRELESLKNQQSGEPISESRFAHQDEIVCIECLTQGVSAAPIHISWKELFIFLAPLMMNKSSQAQLIKHLIAEFQGEEALKWFDPDGPFSGDTQINRADWSKVTLQFLALGYWEPVECSASITDYSGRTPTVRTYPIPGYKLTSLGLQRYAEAAAVLREKEPSK